MKTIAIRRTTSLFFVVLLKKSRKLKLIDFLRFVLMLVCNMYISKASGSADIIKIKYSKYPLKIPLDFINVKVMNKIPNAKIILQTYKSTFISFIHPPHAPAFLLTRHTSIIIHYFRQNTIHLFSPSHSKRTHHY